MLPIDLGDRVRSEEVYHLQQMYYPALVETVSKTGIWDLWYFSSHFVCELKMA